MVVMMLNSSQQKAAGEEERLMARVGVLADVNDLHATVCRAA
jgi:hypothetical protein